MPRFWTVDEARAYLPRLQELVERVREGARAAERVRGNGGSAPDPRLDEALSELSDGDIILRDTDAGLIDFHAVGSDGVVYYLCWRLGEDELGWWHLPEEGFPGRKPLPREAR
jgi:hypothetical protein